MSKENNLPVQPGTETSSSSTNTTPRLTNTSNPGFLASNVPNPISGTNDSSIQTDPPPYFRTDSNYSLPPPYPADEFPIYNANTSSNQNHPPQPPNGPIEVKVQPPYPIDIPADFPVPHLPNSTDPKNPDAPTILLNIISTKSPESRDTSDEPTAPTVEEIDYRIGLTPSEKEEIRRAFSRMEVNVYWKTDEGEAQFNAAQEKIHSILTDAGSRLTEIEKREFILEIKNIDKMRSDWIRKELERRRKIKIENDKKKQKVQKRKDLVNGSIVLKVFELILDCTALLIVDSSTQKPAAARFFSEFSYLAILITGGYLVYYICCIRKKDEAGFILDCLSCFVFSIGYFAFSAVNMDTNARPVGFLTAIIYLIEVGFKMCSLDEENYSQNNSRSGVTNSIPKVSRPRTSRSSIPTRNRYFVRNNTCCHEGNNHLTTNNIHVEDIPGVDYTLNHANTRTLLELLDANSLERNSEVVHSSDNGHRSYSHSRNDSSGENYNFTHHTSSHARDYGDYSTGGGYSGGNDDGGGYSGGGGGGYSGGGDCGGGDSGGGDCGGGSDD